MHKIDASEGGTSGATGGTTGAGGATTGGGTLPSCSGLAATCGPLENEDCCTSLLVLGGTFYRGYDGVDFTDKSFPATVADFYLDKYELTVGRFLITGGAWDSVVMADLTHEFSHAAFHLSDEYDCSPGNFTSRWELVDPYLPNVYSSLVGGGHNGRGW